MFVRAAIVGKTFSSILGAGIGLIVIASCLGCVCAQYQPGIPLAESHAEIALNHLANQLEIYPLPPETMPDLLKQFLRDHDYLTSAAFAYAPARDQGQLIKHLPIVYRQEKGFALIDAVDLKADYEKEPWYADAVKDRQPCWTGWFFDKQVTKKRIKIYSVPVYAKDDPKKLLGVATCALSAD